MIKRYRSAPVAMLIAGLVLAACSTNPATAPSATLTAGSSVAPSATPTTTASSAASESAAPTAVPSSAETAFACTTVQGGPTTERAQLSDVRLGTHAGYDRLTFQFNAGMPRYTVETATPPFTQDASGMPIDVDGSAFLRVTLDGGTKVLPNGGVSYVGETEFKPGYPKIAHVIEGGDFEAVSTWYIGLASDGCFRVTALSSPARLVIDLQH